MTPNKITIVAPVHNESLGLHSFSEAINLVMNQTSFLWELVLVDDGSRDDSWLQIETIARANPNISGIKLSKNYGKDWAIQAGLRYATGEAVVVMDSDLQHPPDLIPALIGKWQEGNEIVVARKKSRPDQSWFIKAGATLWGNAFTSLSGIAIHNETDFRLVSNRVRNELINKTNNRPFFRGDSSSIGFKKATVDFEPVSRQHGISTFNISKLIILAIRSITSFSTKPLHFVTLVAILTMVIAFILFVETLIQWVTQKAADGFTTVICIILFLGSFQLLGIGIIGEYLGLIVENLDKKNKAIVESQTSS